MIETVPPISEETHNSEPSCLNSAKRGRGVDQHIGDDLARRGIDEMRHVGGLGRIDQDLAIRADRHAFGFDADLDVAKPGPLLDIDDGDGVVVLVGDIENFAGGILGKQLGIGAGGQGVHHLQGLGVDHLNGVVVTDRDHHEFAVAGEFDAPRPLTDLDRRRDGPFVGIDDRDGVALLIRNVGGVCPRLDLRPTSHSDHQGEQVTAHAAISPLSS